MVQRCHNKNNASYTFYGGRGIQVCDEWRASPNIFYKWAEDTGYRDNLTIERINNNGNYEPSNCKWVTRKEQANNRKSNHTITFNGMTKTITQWSEETKIPKTCIRDRLLRGWSIERTLTSKIENQYINRTNSHFLTFNGETKTITQWENHYGFSHGTIRGRLNRGKSIEEALNPQKRHVTKKEK